MKNQRQFREPLARKIVIVMVTLGSLLSPAALIAAPPSSAINATPAIVANPDLPDPAAEAARLAHEAAMAKKQANLIQERDALLPKLGAGTLRPQVIRGANAQYQDVSLAFKLDPRLTSSLYMGERWVSPPTYIKTGEGPTCKLEATVRGVDNQGRPANIDAIWTAADPAMVTVSQSPGKPVQITVNRAGETSLAVTAGGFAKKVPLRALSFAETLVVEINQQ